MSQLTNLEEFALQIFLKQLELNRAMPSEILVASSASLAAKLLDEIGSVHMVQTNESEPEQEGAVQEELPFPPSEQQNFPDL